MVVESIIWSIVTIVHLIWYLSKRINTIKTVGICKKILNATRACQGVFEYEIDGIYHYNAESSSHIGWLKEGKKYTIYVKKDNHQKFVSIKVLIELLIFTIFAGIMSIFNICVVIYNALY